MIIYFYTCYGFASDGDTCLDAAEGGDTELAGTVGNNSWFVVAASVAGLAGEAWLVHYWFGGGIAFASWGELAEEAWLVYLYFFGKIALEVQEHLALADWLGAHLIVMTVCYLLFAQAPVCEQLLLISQQILHTSKTEHHPARY